MRHPFRSVVYIQILRNWIAVRVLSWTGGDSHWDGFPEALIVTEKGGRRRVLAMDGESALARQGRHCVLFQHPRTFIDSPDDFSLLMPFFIRKAGLKGIVRGRPMIVLHFRDLIEGGLTPLEETAFRKALGKVGSVDFLFGGNPMPAPELLALTKKIPI